MGAVLAATSCALALACASPPQPAAEVPSSLPRAEVAKPPAIVSMNCAELQVMVLGEVKNSGCHTLAGPTVLDALNAAGGLSDYADPNRIYVVRRSLPHRVQFRYQDLKTADAKSIAFELLPGDVVVVE
jgi:protein involved in polysaccharide export with SLBB domain